MCYAQVQIKATVLLCAETKTRYKEQKKISIIIDKQILYSFVSSIAKKLYYYNTSANNNMCLN